MTLLAFTDIFPQFISYYYGIILTFHRLLIKPRKQATCGQNANGELNKKPHVATPETGSPYRVHFLQHVIQNCSAQRGGTYIKTPKTKHARRKQALMDKQNNIVYCSTFYSSRVKFRIKSQRRRYNNTALGLSNNYSSS